MSVDVAGLLSFWLVYCTLKLMCLMQKITGILVEASSSVEILKTILWKLGELLRLPKPSPLNMKWNLCELSLCSRHACYDRLGIESPFPGRCR